MEDTAQEQILSYFRDYGTATASELAQSLLLSSADIRYHLQKLIRSRAIEIVAHETNHPGRPERRFQLSSAYKPNDYPFLVRALLTHADAEQWLLDLPTSFLGAPFSGPMPLRLNQCIQWLNQHHYHASWIARPQGPTIQLRNCPYSDLLPQHCILCKMDERFLEYSLSTKVVSTSKFFASSNLHPLCEFAVKI